MPPKPSTLAKSVPNTRRVLASPASAISQTASAANTRISNSPRIVPAPVESRTPNHPSRNTITAAATAATTHQVS
jgi:hypothetical protein